MSEAQNAAATTATQTVTNGQPSLLDQIVEQGRFGEETAQQERGLQAASTCNHFDNEAA